MIQFKKVAAILTVIAAAFTFFPGSVYALNTETSGALEGVVKDAETGDPISFVYIHLEEINRNTTTNRHGEFSISNLPSGNYTLLMHRLGYASKSYPFIIRDDETTTLSIELRPTILTGSAVEVTAQAGDFRGSNLEHASIKVTGADLRRNLGVTLSETLSNKPGFEQRTMGAAPARPVLRGLGDERLLILQDGERTGDVSATSADHSVTVDPLGADEIEIARGPAALAYGSNAIGGVINVVRNQIANTIPTNITGTATLQGSSVNTGFSGAGFLSIPHNDFVYNIDLNGRYGGNYNSPEGTIQNSGFFTTNSSAGVSYVRPWGYSGLAISTFLSDYGIPPDPEGGHPNGVDIEMRKFQVENRNEFLVRDSFFKLIETQLSYRYYNHKEFETADIIGTEYIVNSINTSLKSSHREIGFLKNGIIGFWGEFKDYIVIDRANIETNSFSGSLYSIQESDIGPLHIELGARLDANIVRPKEERFSQLIGDIRQRSFLGLATSASLIYDLGRGWNLGTVFMHSFRPPSSEELFSQGPHIAAYSFEIGNPELDPERGFGKELFLRYKSGTATLELAGFHNDFSNYIFPRDTGRESIPFPSLNEFQYEATRAEIYGLEAQTELQLSSNFVANASFAYTVGTRDVSEEEREASGIESQRDPLPMIPPLNTSIGLTYNYNQFSLGGRFRYSGKQDRVADFEEPTDAFTLIDLHSQYRFSSSGNSLHTFSLNVNNLLNTEYRNHLSRLKEVFPEPGININLLYRLYF